MSACMASRFRSRQVICMIASRPFCCAVTPDAMEQTRTTAVWLSVMLTAST